MNDKSIRLLEQLFEEERACLMAGDLSRLERMSSRKAHLCAALEGAALTSAEQKRFAALSARNQSLLLAAREGLEAARHRLAEIQRGAPVGTYSKSGEKTEIARPVRTLQRRA